jgi:tight adherence protein B
MDGYLFPILVATAVALLAYGAAQATAVLAGGERRKIQQRLASDTRAHAASSAVRSAILSQQERDVLAAALRQFSFFEGVSRRLTHAFPDMTLTRFLSCVAGSALGTCAVVFLVTGSLFVAAVAGAVGAWAPFMVVTHRRNKRQRVLADQLPEALDFLARVLRAGHSFSTGLQMMSEELPQPLAAEFRRAYDQHSLGMTIDEALKDAATRIDSTDFAFFVTAVLVQRQTGGDLSEVLDNISGMIRQRIRLEQQVKAKTAEGRFTGYILSAFPAVMFVISYMLNPDYAGVLIRTSEGVKLLAAALLLEVLGLYFIKKITTVKV